MKNFLDKEKIMNYQSMKKTCIPKTKIKIIFPSISFEKAFQPLRSTILTKSNIECVKSIVPLIYLKSRNVKTFGN